MAPGLGPWHMEVWELRGHRRCLGGGGFWRKGALRQVQVEVRDNAGRSLERFTGNYGGLALPD